MLVLSRFEGEFIDVPQLNVSVVVVRVNGSSARIGVECPAGHRVLRRELVGKPQAEEFNPRGGRLVLTRRKSESIIVPSLGFEVMLVDTRGANKARLGVTAPDDMKIFRRELLEKMQSEGVKNEFYRPAFADS